MGALRGKRIVVTRPQKQAGELIDLLLQHGAVPVPFPTIEIHPPADLTVLDEAIVRLEEYDWLIFTSINGVSIFWDRLVAAEKNADSMAHLKIAAIGPATSLALTRHGLAPHLVPDEFVAEGLLDGFPDVSGKRILIPRAQEARPVLVDGLQTRGALVDEIPVYRTLPARPNPEAIAELQAGVDAITFTSSSTVTGFINLVSPQVIDRLKTSGCLVACIGPVTARTAVEKGLEVRVVAAEYTGRGLVQALDRYFQAAA
jgi:uroporphyrinogen-III synthase